MKYFQNLLPWGPWFSFIALKTGNNILGVCDYLGETLASLFGITSPKYLKEIEKHRRKKLKEEETKMELEYGGWRENKNELNENILIHDKEKF